MQSLTTKRPFFHTDCHGQRPTVANDDSVTTDEDTPVTFNALDNENDIDGSGGRTQNQGKNGAAVENGPLYDSTQP